MTTNELLLTSSQSSQQFSVCLWDYNTLNVHKFYRNGGTVPPKCLEVVGQDYILSAESAKPLLHVWPLHSQDVAKNIRLILPEPASCLAICPRNTYLAVGISCKVYVWQISSGNLLSVQQKNYQPITTIKFSSDGEYLLIAGQDGMLIGYNFSELISFSNNFLTQSEIGQIEPIYTKNDHSMPIRDIHIGTFGKKSRFTTVSSDQTCRIYNLVDGEPLLTLVFEEMLTAVIFDAPCWQLFVGKNNGDVSQFNLKNPPRTTFHHIDEKNSLTFCGHKKKVVCLAVNISNTILASGSDDNFVYTWEIKSRQILKKIEHKAAISNIKFVLGYKNFTAESFKPRIVFKPLSRSTDLPSSNLVVSQMQTYDIDLSDDENSLEKENSRKELSNENMKLRATNKQLYSAALEISKKYNKVND